jgi:ligand-binding sensor domain-containing protein
LHQNITGLYEDRAGALWVGSTGGLDRSSSNRAGERPRLVFPPTRPTHRP